MANDRGLWRGMDSGGSGRVILRTKSQAIVVDFERERCLGKFPIAEDTIDRLICSPEESVCIVASWSAGLSAWDYQSGIQKWINPVKHIASLAAFGDEVIKGRLRGTILVDAFNGRTIRHIDNYDVFKHPSEPITANFNLTLSKLVIKDDRSLGCFTFHVGSFAILDLAWCDSSIVYSEPDGTVSACSFLSGQRIFQSSARGWFNVSDLTYCKRNGELYAIATGWEGQPAKALLKISPNQGIITKSCVLPNEPFYCFLNKGSVLACSDGSVYDPNTGLLCKRLDWESLMK